jgi:hypothetical protein
MEFFLPAQRDALQVRHQDGLFRHRTQECPGFGIGAQELSDSQAFILRQATVEVSEQKLVW